MIFLLKPGRNENFSHQTTGSPLSPLVDNILANLQFDDNRKLFLGTLILYGYQLKVASILHIFSLFEEMYWTSALDYLLLQHPDRQLENSIY
ncbi:MAG TPA: hypothetical protein DEV81_10805 [Cyanobacteria bacterium UBA11049]|nr:hypothetical protein [Cyanobacteria bacterium UBA11049]